TVLVATDDERIAALARAHGVEPVMTDSALPSGSDRVWAAIQGFDGEVVLNIQGDEPLLTGDLLDQLVAPFEADQSLEMATFGRELTAEDLASPNTAKIVLNQRDEALYFSRHPIPFSREPFNAGQDCGLKHIGIYGFRRSFLGRFCAQKPVELEKYEGLEQLRALYLGARIKVVRVDHESWGVDTPEDVLKVEKRLRGK
ncbi:MAG TPA: 3-deoxy-manno-octulosonate cytidylyltransferase, partial [Bdellovibrionales bacterium]|nr:3-deoxy-manno-octulosonate cytidylyltransferase [Bdellovibrionales bacterium]